MSTPDLIHPPALAPSSLRLIFFWFLTFGLVSIEPAPFDLLFVPVVAFFLMKSRLVLSRHIGPLFLCLVLFLVANLLSLLGASDLPRAVSFMAITIYSLLFGCFISVLVANFGYRIIDKIMSAYVAVALVSAVLGVAAILHWLPESMIDLVTLYDQTRAKAFFKDPNVYAPFLMVALVYAADRFFQKPQQRLFWGGCLFTLVFGLLVGFSRAAWGASVCALVFYFVLSAVADRRFSRVFQYLSVLLVLSLLGGVLVSFFAREANIASFIDSRMGMQAYDEDRFEVQGAAAAAGLKSVIGIGPGQSEDAFVELVSHGQGTGATHSLYVRIISETGILGALSFFGLLFFTGRKAINLAVNGTSKHRKLHAVFCACFFATMINSIVIDSLHWRHFFLVIGFIWGLDQFHLIAAVRQKEAKRLRDVDVTNG